METNEKIDIIIKAAADIAAGTKALGAYLDNTAWDAMTPEQRGKVYAAVADCADSLDTLKDMARATLSGDGTVGGLKLQASSPKYDVQDWQTLFKHLTTKYPTLTRSVLEGTLSCSYPQVRKLAAPLAGPGKEGEAKITSELCGAGLVTRKEVAASLKRCV